MLAGHRRKAVLTSLLTRWPAWARSMTTCLRTASKSTGWKTKLTAWPARPSPSCSKKKRIPISLIKLKELYEVLETATDKAEDAANVLEGVVLKSA